MARSKKAVTYVVPAGVILACMMCNDNFWGGWGGSTPRYIFPKEDRAVEDIEKNDANAFCRPFLHNIVSRRVSGVRAKFTLRRRKAILLHCIDDGLEILCIFCR